MSQKQISYSIDTSVAPRFYYKLLKNSIKVFYIEAGSREKPTLLLLHGFPTSSRMFRELILLLSSFFHIIAPDLPTFGLTEVPESYSGTFEHFAEIVDLLLSELDIEEFLMFVFDYGAPTGFRLALKRPDQVQAIITQNGNAYEEGLGEFWVPLKELWKFEDNGGPSTAEDQKEYDLLLSNIGNLVTNIDGYNFQYYDGENDSTRVNPEVAKIDKLLLNCNEKSLQAQLDLFLDYRNNVKMYPKFQQYFRNSNVPILAVWGVNDKIFIRDGQKAFKKDSRNVKLVELDGGHFASHSHFSELAQEIVIFAHEKGLI